MNENDFVNEISYTQLSHANDFIRYSLQFKVRGYESKMYKKEIINKNDVNEVDDLGQMSLLSTIICSNKDERIYKGKKNVR